MNRRDTVLALLALHAAPFSSFAQQQTKVWRIGLLMGRSRPASLETDFYGAFPKAMRELGYIEGKNVQYEWRFADGKVDPLAGLAAELVRLKVDVIVTGGISAVRAAQQATRTIPIVMASAPDPMGSGLVASLARPGGNITGLSNVAVDVSPKLLEMLLVTTPNVTRIAVLRNPNNPASEAISQNLRTAAQITGRQLSVVDARTPTEIERAFSAMTQQRAEALIVANDNFFIQQRHQIGDLAAKFRLPAIYSLREHAEAGGLMSYGANRAEFYARAATYG